MEFTELDPEENLWRYLDLGKFLELMNSRSLYFTRSDKFEDRFEGTVNRHTHTVYVKFVEDELKRQGKKEILDTSLKYKGEYVGIIEKPDDIGASLSKFLYWIRTYTFISCWHRNRNESEAMWCLYCKNLSEAMVIRSKVKKLAASLPPEITMSPVAYVDFAGPTTIS